MLRRSLSLLQVVLYGLGTTIGAGIYLLIGEVAKVAGAAAPTAFLVSSLLAAFTALSFGELVSRFRQSDGPAAYVREGFGRRNLATAIGLLVATAGCVSAAAMANVYNITACCFPRSAISPIAVGVKKLGKDFNLSSRYLDINIFTPSSLHLD